MKFRTRNADPGTRMNITPLIDINANLLFFMMVSASVQEDRLEAGENVELPVSSSRKAQGGDLVSVVIAKDAVTVNEVEVVKLKDAQVKRRDLDRKRTKVRPLYKELKNKFQHLLDEKGHQPGADGKEGKPLVVMVQADKDIPYTTLSIIMRTCGEAGFTKFRFAAKGQ